MDQLNALTYLEGVVRESLRLYAPVSSTNRIAIHDAEIPLQKPFTDKSGVLQSTVRWVQIVTIPVQRVNRMANSNGAQGLPKATWCPSQFVC